MVSEFGSFRFMGVPNISQAVIPEKDLINDMEFSLHPVRSSSSEEEEKVEEVDEQEEKRRRHRQVCVALKIQIPSSYEEEEEKGGLKTPTSKVHRISSEMLKCPGAPRKPKSIPLSSTKRKPTTPPRFLLDLSKEIESLFPRPIVLDLGGKIKKVKQAM